MEIPPEIKAYFEAKKGHFGAIDNYFADDVCIEDIGQNDTINGFDNCKKWLKEKSRQYKMETKIVEIKTEENGNIKVSTLANVNYSPNNFLFDYIFTIHNEKIKTIKIVYTGK